MNWHCRPFIVVLILVLFFSCTRMYGQYSEKQMKDDFALGEEYIEKNRFDAALEFYLRIYDHFKDNAYLNYRIGQCYYNIYENRFRSIPFLQFAAGNVSVNVTEKDYLKGTAPAEAVFLLGDVLLKAGNLEDSYKYFNLFKSLEGNESRDNLSQADDKLTNIAVAYQLQENRYPIENEEPFSEINSRFSDYNPVFSVDGSTLVYTSFWESADLIFMAQKKKEKWSVPVDITGDLGSDGNFYATSLTGNGKTLYAVMRGFYNSDIYASNLTGRKWDVLMPLPKKINTGDHEVDAFVTSDGKALYFASNRKGGSGGFDIYRSLRKGNDWESPVNLGNVINSSHNEGNPYLTPDNSIFIFSSDGHKGMGGKDLFYCIVRSDGSFSSPVNFGYPVNTTEDNNTLVYFNETSQAYYTRDTREHDKRIDIFSFTMAENILRQAADLNRESIMLASINTSRDYVNGLGNLLSQLYADEPAMAPATTNPEFKKSPEIYPPSDNEEPGLTSDGNEDYMTDLTPPQKGKEQHVAATTIIPGTILTEKAAVNKDKRTYTVQIMALKNYRDPGYFNEFEDVMVVRGPDGFYRYTVGEYASARLALSATYTIRSLGYKDAFMRRIASIPGGR